MFWRDVFVKCIWKNYIACLYEINTSGNISYPQWCLIRSTNPRQWTFCKARQVCPRYQLSKCVIFTKQLPVISQRTVGYRMCHQWDNNLGCPLYVRGGFLTSNYRRKEIGKLTSSFMMISYTADITKINNLLNFCFSNFKGHAFSLCVLKTPHPLSFHLYMPRKSISNQNKSQCQNINTITLAPLKKNAEIRCFKKRK